jgi:hypothetical protein
MLSQFFSSSTALAWVPQSRVTYETLKSEHDEPNGYCGSQDELLIAEKSERSLSHDFITTIRWLKMTIVGLAMGLAILSALWVLREMSLHKIPVDQQIYCQ